jgi:hypothetical protein
LRLYLRLLRGTKSKDRRKTPSKLKVPTVQSKGQSKKNREGRAGREDNIGRKKENTEGKVIRKLDESLTKTGRED